MGDRLDVPICSQAHAGITVNLIRTAPEGSSMQALDSLGLRQRRGMLVIVLTLGAIVAAGGVVGIVRGVDAVRMPGSRDAIERTAPVFNRPADRPSTTTHTFVEPGRGEGHHPTDRPPRSGTRILIEPGRPTDRPE
jgi:hypothetical protein